LPLNAPVDGTPAQGHPLVPRPLAKAIARRRGERGYQQGGGAPAHRHWGLNIEQEHIVLHSSGSPGQAFSSAQIWETGDRGAFRGWGRGYLGSEADRSMARRPGSTGPKTADCPRAVRRPKRRPPESRLLKAASIKISVRHLRPLPHGQPCGTVPPSFASPCRCPLPTMPFPFSPRGHYANPYSRLPFDLPRRHSTLTYRAVTLCLYHAVPLWLTGRYPLPYHVVTLCLTGRYPMLYPPVTLCPTLPLLFGLLPCSYPLPYHAVMPSLTMPLPLPLLCRYPLPFPAVMPSLTMPLPLPLLCRYPLPYHAVNRRLTSPLSPPNLHHGTARAPGEHVEGSVRGWSIAVERIWA
jgi:hypothetical protein